MTNKEKFYLIKLAQNREPTSKQQASLANLTPGAGVGAMAGIMGSHLPNLEKSLARHGFGVHRGADHKDSDATVVQDAINTPKYNPNTVKKELPADLEDMDRINKEEDMLKDQIVIPDRAGRDVTVPPKRHPMTRLR